MSGASGFLRELSLHLSDCGISFMLTGSFVSSYYGDPRTTRDLDLVINAAEPPDESIVTFVSLCEASGWYTSTTAALGPLNPDRVPGEDRRQFDVIDAASGWKADIMWAKDRLFSQSEFDRRVSINLLGQIVQVPTPEDVILAKLEWGANRTSRQFDDAVSVLQVIGTTLDFGYLRFWAEQLGLQTMLDEAVAAAAI
jgi:hypothetical protein